MSNIKYVGMDVHKAITVIVVLDERGQFVSRAQVKTKAEPLGDFFRGLTGLLDGADFEADGAHAGVAASAIALTNRGQVVLKRVLGPGI